MDKDINKSINKEINRNINKKITGSINKMEVKIKIFIINKIKNVYKKLKFK